MEYSNGTSNGVTGFVHEGDGMSGAPDQQVYPHQPPAQVYVPQQPQHMGYVQYNPGYGPPPHVHQPQYIPPQQPQSQPFAGLGQTLSAMPWWAAMVMGAVGWAFFGETIKAAFGLGKRAAAIGVDRAHKQLDKHEKGGV